MTCVVVKFRGDVPEDSALFYGGEHGFSNALRGIESESDMAITRAVCLTVHGAAIFGLDPACGIDRLIKEDILFDRRY